MMTGLCTDPACAANESVSRTANVFSCFEVGHKKKQNQQSENVHMMVHPPRHYGESPTPSPGQALSKPPIFCPSPCPSPSQALSKPPHFLSKPLSELSSRPTKIVQILYLGSHAIRPSNPYYNIRIKDLYSFQAFARESRHHSCRSAPGTHSRIPVLEF